MERKVWRAAGVVMVAAAMLVAALPALATGLPTAQATATPTWPEGVIIAQLVNGTVGAAPPADVPVTLYALDAALETVFFTRTAQTDSSGHARFEGVQIVPGQFYVVVVDYQNVLYYAEPQHFPPDQMTLTLLITVYESTADAGVIRIEQLHVILKAQTGRVLVDGVMVASNTSDRAYINRDGASLRVLLPHNAADLQFPDSAWSGRYVPLDDGFVDTEAVRPGQAHQVLFSFILPYDGQSLDVTLPALYRVQNVNVLVRGDGVQLNSPQLVASGSRQTPEGVYLNFASAGPLEAGQALSFRLTGRAAGAATAYWPVAIIGAALAVVLGALVWRRSRQAVPARVEAPDKEELLDAIADLDEAYEAGEIAESDYRREREELKSLLVEMMNNA